MSVSLIVTAFALYGEGTGMESWQCERIGVWVIPPMGQREDVHTWHHLVILVIVHIVVVIREDIMSRQSLISTMVSGWRVFKGSRDLDDAH